MSHLSAVRKINEVIVGAGGQANIQFSSIDQRYRHLRLDIVGQITEATTDDYCLMRFNGDTGTNYAYEIGQFTNNTPGTSPSAVLGTGHTSLLIADLLGSTGLTNTPGVATVTIYDYARTVWYKATWSQVQERYATSGFQVQVYAGLWQSTAAITSILLFPASGNFVQGSVASLYGWL